MAELKTIRLKKLDNLKELDEEKTTLALSNVIVISNKECVDNGADPERAYKIGMYDENGKYIDLSAGFGTKGLLKSISDDSDIENGILTIEVL